ncbi:MAG: hypothetical protein AAF657_05300 [Acidobacteriota bacterium]
MQTQIDSLDQLELLQAPELTLYSTAGRVISVRQFARETLGHLSPEEQIILRRQLDALPGEEDLPFERPVLRTRALADGREELPARRSGARSAFVPSLGLKLKGCRPEKAEFPEWALDDQFELQIRKIPFGVLEAEGVAREILSYCFLKEFDLPLAQTPVAVFEYGEAGANGYALVSAVNSDERLESRLDCGGITVHRLLRLSGSGDRPGLLGREVSLHGIEQARYIDCKAKMLADLNFNGGFRGVLNSNIGNDMVEGGDVVALCDFDDFSIRQLPQAEDTPAIRQFVIRAILELLKSSLPIVDYVDLTDLESSEAKRTLAASYRDKSSLFQTYADLLLERSRHQGWPAGLVEQAIDEAFELDVAFEILQELIPNSVTLSEFTLESCYVPHN